MVSVGIYVSQKCVQHRSVIQVHKASNQKTKKETDAKKYQAAKEKQVEKYSDTKEKSERDVCESTIKI